MTKSISGLLGLTAALLAVAGAAAAQSTGTNPPVPDGLAKILGCQGISENATRLACYDREIVAMEDARRRGDLVAMDRREVRRAKRSLFGLALPDLGVFGDADGDSDDEKAIETTIRKVSSTPDGKWIFQLAEGGSWIQTDSKNLPADPRAGQTIRVRRAALGSYFANINKMVAIRVRRMN